VFAACGRQTDKAAYGEDAPDETVGDRMFGVVNVSVADARMEADFASEMGTQLLLGMPLQVRRHDGWWQITAPEGYTAWMPEGSFVRMTKESFNEWIASPKIVFTAEYGFAYEKDDANGGRVSDLVFGCLLKREGEAGIFYRVSYPDGRTACVLKSQSQPLDEWLASVRLTEESLVQKALSLKGIPYSWGGTSTKAMDCSGFVKTVLLMHGVILRRDASQQAETGIPVDISEGYDNLRPGDLMFFGKQSADGTKERIRHVAIYLGEKAFIHASDYVKVGSLDAGSDNYDAHNTREFIRASRILGAVNTEGIWELLQNPLYQQQ
jgi:cell wall-associated NlpC family hydrolase